MNKILRRQKLSKKKLIWNTGKIIDTGKNKRKIRTG